MAVAVERHIRRRRKHSRGDGGVRRVEEDEEDLVFAVDATTAVSPEGFSAAEASDSSELPVFTVTTTLSYTVSGYVVLAGV